MGDSFNGQNQEGKGFSVTLQSQSSTLSLVSHQEVLDNLGLFREAAAKQAEHLDDVKELQAKHAAQVDQFKVMHEQRFDATVCDLQIMAKAMCIGDHQLQSLQYKPGSSLDLSLKDARIELLQVALEEAVSYKLQETVWDAAILMGMPLSIGPTDTAILALAVFLQAFMQSALCIILVVLAQANGDDLERSKGMLHGCENHDQYALFMEDSHGPLLSCLVIMMWTLCVLKEVRHIGDSLMAFWNLPRGPHTNLAVHDQSRKLMLVQISILRLVFVTLSCMLQLAVAACLLVVGAMWLASTVNRTDLLLNAVALQFIMEIDELVFHVFCSAKVKTITNSLHPLTLPSRWVLPNKLPLRALSSLFGWAGFCGAILFIYLRPAFDIMDDVVQRNCS